MNRIRQRKMERYGLNIPARVTIQGNTLGHERKRSMHLTTKNVSAGGAFLITDRPLRAGTRLEVGLSLSFYFKEEDIKKESHVQVRGEVIRVETNGMVVRFDRRYQISAVEKNL